MFLVWEIRFYYSFGSSMMLSGFKVQVVFVAWRLRLWQPLDSFNFDQNAQSCLKRNPTKVWTRVQNSKCVCYLSNQFGACLLLIDPQNALEHRIICKHILAINYLFSFAVKKKNFLFNLFKFDERTCKRPNQTILCDYIWLQDLLRLIVKISSG